jgi:hypothetical protein
VRELLLSARRSLIPVQNDANLPIAPLMPSKGYQTGNLRGSLTIVFPRNRHCTACGLAPALKLQRPARPSGAGSEDGQEGTE